MSPSDTQRPPNSSAPYDSKSQPTACNILRLATAACNWWIFCRIFFVSLAYRCKVYRKEKINRRRKSIHLCASKVASSWIQPHFTAVFRPCQSRYGSFYKTDTIHIYSTLWAEGSFAEQMSYSLFFCRFRYETVNKINERKA